FHAEIIAVHSACSLAFNHGWFNAIVESDSQIAIFLSSLDMSPPWSLAALVDDIRLWAKYMHISCDVSFPDEFTSLSRSDLYGC
ncbi:hypothetical protein Tco_0384115, partial [Tanacetum coccineum]